MQDLLPVVTCHRPVFFVSNSVLSSSRAVGCESFTESPWPEIYEPEIKDVSVQTERKERGTPAAPLPSSLPDREPEEEEEEETQVSFTYTCSFFTVGNHRNPCQIARYLPTYHSK